MASHGIADRTWTTQAACRTSGLPPDTWYPTPGDHNTAETAKRICRTCPVRLNCALYAEQARIPYGIWAGLRRNQHGRIDAHQQRALR